LHRDNSFQGGHLVNAAAIRPFGLLRLFFRFVVPVARIVVAPVSGN
jgi:hypothetical protein